MTVWEIAEARAGLGRTRPIEIGLPPTTYCAKPSACVTAPTARVWSM